MTQEERVEKLAKILRDRMWFDERDPDKLYWVKGGEEDFAKIVLDSLTLDTDKVYRLVTMGYQALYSKERIKKVLENMSSEIITVEEK